MSRDTPMRDHRSTGPDTEEARWPIVDVVVPALNEQRAITRVLADLPADRVRRVVVVDNASSDATARRAEAAGASVVYEPVRGYGSACLRGIRALAEGGLPPDVVVFVDADYSDHPDELTQLVEPLAAGRADFVVGSRTLGEREPGSLLPQARFGNWLAAWLIRRLYGMQVTDLGPFRAIRWSTLMDLDMADADFGWTAEMQVKAARAGVRYVEVPASYRRRIGASKITGTLSGTLRAGWKILYTVFRGR
jgi:glycosyltransferase involved in cell wall biosynthesis